MLSGKFSFKNYSYTKMFWNIYSLTLFLLWLDTNTPKRVFKWGLDTCKTIWKWSRHPAVADLAWARGLDHMTSRGPFQPPPIDNFMILWNAAYQRKLTLRQRWCQWLKLQTLEMSQAVRWMHSFNFKYPHLPSPCFFLINIETAFFWF